MKKKYTWLSLLIFTVMLSGSLNLFAQGTWTQKATSPSKRAGGIAFAIGSKGYVGLGNDSINYRNDFWEYDPATNVWTQKANYSGSGRLYAAAFATSAAGYVVGGHNGSAIFSDVWSYNPTANSWTQRTGFPGTARYAATALCIGNNGYFGTGYNGSSVFFDFWEYNTTSNSWTQKANVGGGTTGARAFCAAIHINGKGYLGGGWNGNYLSDFYEYNPANNSWTPKASLGSGPVTGHTAFTINTKGYFAGGYSSNLSTRIREVWEYDPSNDTWTRKQDLPMSSKQDAQGFAVNGKGYVGGGRNDGAFVTDFAEFDPANFSAWDFKWYFPSSDRRDAFSFTIGDKGYLGTGYSTGTSGSYIFSDFWEYDANEGTWTQKANFGGGYRSGATGFSIGNKGYAGTGFYNASYFQDFYEYDPVTNTWTNKANFGGGLRSAAIAFTIGNTGYMGTGLDGTNRFNDIWAYNPANNSWSQKASLSSAVRSSAVAFTIGNKAYAGTGWNGTSYFNDFWEYNPGNDTWTQKANFSGTARNAAVGISIGTRGYIGTGTDGLFTLDDMWEYNPVTNTWVARENFIGEARLDASSFSFNDRAFICIGANAAGNTLADIWEFFPLNLRVKGLVFQGSNCAGDSVKVGYWTARNAQPVTFQLSNAAGSFSNPVTLSSFTSGHGPDSVKVKIPSVTPYGNAYMIRMVSGTDTSNLSKPFTIGIAPTTVTSARPGFCPGDTTLLTATAGTGVTYQWLKNGAAISGANISTYIANTPGVYRMVLTASPTCHDTSAGVTVSQYVRHPAGFTVNNFTQCLVGNNFVLNDTSTGIVSRIWNFGNGAGDTSYAAGPSKIYTSANQYTIKLVNTNASGCMDSTTRVVNVISSPAIPTFTYSPDTIVCANQGIVLRTSSTLAKEWLKDGSPVGISADSIVIINAPGAYSLRVGATGCSSTSASVNLSFKPAPPKPVVSVSGSTLTSSASAGNQWYNSSGIISGQTGQTYNAPGPGNYHTIVTSNGCSTSSDTIHFTGVGIKGVSLNLKAIVYPNPSNGTLRIILANTPANKVRLEIFDITGRVVFTKITEAKETTIETEGLADGAYLLYISSNDQQERVRLIIRK